jgi:polyribonucleotide nucleotidyltransferase
MGQTINPFGKDIISVEAEFCGRKLTLETGRLAFQAGGAVLATYGDTVVFASAVANRHHNPHMDYFPLSIEYEEKMYAAGKISGSRFIKREGRPSDNAILTGRLIDRPIRPLFPKGFHNEVQVIISVLSLDPELKPDTIGMIAASAAISLTGAPFDGPIGGVRIGHVNGKLTPFPTTTELKDSKLDLMVAGTKDAIMMVEAGADEIDEDTMVQALELAHESIQPVVKMQEELVSKVGVEAFEYELQTPDESVQKVVDEFLADKKGEGLRGDNQHERMEKVHEMKAALLETLKTELGEDEDLEPYKEAFEYAMKQEVRRAIIEDGIRPDNRKTDEIRPLSSEVGILPRTHGSSLFTRGSTQALNVTTLAPLSYSQVIDTMEEDTESFYFHHYNMPGYSTGEARRVGSPGRREIGHGHLAQRAIQPMLPSQEDFPYTIRSVSELLSSNGSTSMASVCSSCMSLMDAGVPLKRPVSGIAMGLITNGDDPIILSDIQGTEDFAGDMDFKVAGTSEGITALQMDIKVKGISTEIMAKALAQAKEGRAFILAHMLETLAEPRKEISQFAPQIAKIMINPERIRDVIGKGGETINKIIAETGAEIDIRDEGLVLISSPDRESIDKAIQWVKDLTTDPEPGTIYEAKVVKIMDFGAFVRIPTGQEGLVHVSEMAEERVENVTDIVSEGDPVTVKLVAIDNQGRLNFSMKEAARDQKS